MLVDDAADKLGNADTKLIGFLLQEAHLRFGERYGHSGCGAHKHHFSTAVKVSKALDASSLIGVPFLDRGRTRAGVDCWGAVTVVFQEQLGITLPPWDTIGHQERAAIAATVVKSLPEWTPVPPGSEQAFDVIVLRVHGRPIHCALVIAPGLMLHAQPGTAVCAEPYSAPRWRSRITGFYRHRDLA